MLNKFNAISGGAEGGGDLRAIVNRLTASLVDAQTALDTSQVRVCVHVCWI
jgi:hypothetical protein